MTEEELKLLKMWILNMQTRLENDFTDARNDFSMSQNAWFAFRLALAGERKSFFDTICAQLYALLKF